MLAYTKKKFKKFSLGLSKLLITNNCFKLFKCKVNKTINFLFFKFQKVLLLSSSNVLIKANL